MRRAGHLAQGPQLAAHQHRARAGRGQGHQRGEQGLQPDQPGQHRLHVVEGHRRGHRGPVGQAGEDGPVGAQAREVEVLRAASQGQVAQGLQAGVVEGALAQTAVVGHEDLARAVATGGPRRGDGARAAPEVPRPGGSPVAVVVPRARVVQRWALDDPLGLRQVLVEAGHQHGPGAEGGDQADDHGGDDHQAHRHHHQARGEGDRSPHEAGLRT